MALSLKARRLAGFQRWRAELKDTAPKCGKPTRKGTPCSMPLVNGKCLTHDGMSPAARRDHCRRLARQHWKGDRAKPASGRRRAQRWYDVDRCERCGAKPEDKRKLHRHHKDRNTRNNQRENIEILCEPCHITEHGGQAVWFGENERERERERAGGGN